MLNDSQFIMLLDMDKIFLNDDLNMLKESKQEVASEVNILK